METASEKTWLDTLEAEIRSGQSPPQVEGVRSLASLYDQLGLPDEGLNLARRAVSHGVDRAGLLPYFINGLLRKRSVSELGRLTQLGLRAENRSPELQRSLANALPVVGQAALASAEWSSLVKANEMNDEDWLHLAHFLVKHGCDPKLAQALEHFIGRPLSHQRIPMVCFCVLRSRMDAGSYSAAASALSLISPKHVPDPELACTLAIMAWRLGAFSKALKAARHALWLQDSPVIRSVMSSILSFQGKFKHFESCIRVAREVVELIQSERQNTRSEQFIWGYVYRDENGSFQVRKVGWTRERTFEIPEDHRPVVSFSILPSVKYADPCEVLAFLDWSVPHFMLLRRGRSPKMHAFVASSAHQEWQWQEVAWESGQDERPGHSATPDPKHTFWNQIVQELHERKEEM